MMLELFVPPRCLACRAPGQEPWCAGCARAAADLRDGRLEPLAESVRAVAAYRYEGPVAAAVRTVKVERLRRGAVLLAAILAAAIAVPGWPVTWVPAPRHRRRARGLDLPEVLAGRHAIRLLDRCGNPADQTSLDGSRRRTAPLGTFVVIRAPPRQVVLVDDVRTTGSTALAAARALLAAGTRRVLVVTLAVSAADRPGGAGRERSPPRRRG